MSMIEDTPHHRRFVSPKEIHAAACKMMLNGQRPSCEADWVKVVNFYAVNVAKEVQPDAIVFLCVLMNCPLPRIAIEAICMAQGYMSEHAN